MAWPAASTSRWPSPSSATWPFATRSTNCLTSGRPKPTSFPSSCSRSCTTFQSSSSSRLNIPEARATAPTRPSCRTWSTTSYLTTRLTNPTSTESCQPNWGWIKRITRFVIEIKYYNYYATMASICKSFTDFLWLQCTKGEANVITVIIIIWLIWSNWTWHLSVRNFFFIHHLFI